MKTVPTVYELRKQGWKVKVGHHRRYFRYDAFTGRKITMLFLQSTVEEAPENWFLSATGGKTTVYITTDSKVELYGEANCSEKEHYNKRSGLKKAIARALAE